MRVQQDNIHRTARKYMQVEGNKRDKYTSWQTKIEKWIWDLAPVGQRIQFLGDPAYLEQLLIHAGLEQDWRVEQIHGAKMLGLICGIVISFLYLLLGLPLAFLFVPSLLIGGFLSPILYLKKEGKKRQENMRLALPDFLDMMSVTLKAGMSFDIALGYYTKVTKTPLAEEFSRFLQELHFGIERETAYRAIQRRVTVRELHALIQTLVQVHRLGAPVAQVFADQAKQMRGLRTEKAKEAAGKAAPRISLISGLVIAPSIFLFVLGMILLKSFFSPDSPLHMFFSK
jgi:tight adherence protein C